MRKSYLTGVLGITQPFQSGQPEETGMALTHGWLFSLLSLLSFLPSSLPRVALSSSTLQVGSDQPQRWEVKLLGSV